MAITSLSSIGTAAQPATDSTTPRAAPAAAAAQPSPPSRQAVEDAAKKIRDAMATMSSWDLRFSVDGDTKQTVVRVIDTQSGAVIRQIPAQEVIDIAKAMDRAQGLLLRQEA